jgi:ribosomal protein L11 methyltransferase
MAWQQLVLLTDRQNAAVVESALTEFGSLSITIEDAGDEPIFEPEPGETPVWADLRVTGLFSEGTDMDLLVSEIRNSMPFISVVQVQELSDRVWEREWMAHFEPMKFGQRLWICPTGCDVPESNGIAIMLDPGLAFGTGTHETTALCLEWLDGYDLSGMTVIDYGCGSGVLAIAALVLGSERVVAVDIDPQALQATRNNGASNHIATHRLEITTPKACVETRADVLLANILAGPLIELTSRFAELLKPEGKIVLSGILKSQCQDIEMAYSRFFDLDKPVTRGDWVRLSGTRKL